MTKHSTVFRRAGFFAAATVLALGATAAHAITYTFDSTAVGGFGAGPYGTVTLTDNGTGVDFTVQLRSDLDFVNTGGPHSVFTFNALGVATTDVSNIMFNGVAAGGGFHVVTSGDNTPFGTDFSLAIDCTDGALCANGAPGKSVDPLTFTVADAELSDFGFLAAGTTAFFAADAICVNTSVIAEGCVGATGAIGVTGPGDTDTDTDTDVPEPDTLALLGLGLIGIGALRRRKG